MLLLLYNQELKPKESVLQAAMILGERPPPSQTTLVSYVSMLSLTEAIRLVHAYDVEFCIRAKAADMTHSLLMVQEIEELADADLSKADLILVEHLTTDYLPEPESRNVHQTKSWYEKGLG